MKLVHYYPGALRGEFGTATAVRGWCQSLARLGHDVMLIVDRDKLLLAGPEHVRIVDVAHGGKPYRARRSLTTDIAGADLLVLHGGWGLHNLLAASQARRAGVPYMVMPHGAYFPQVFERRSSNRKSVWWKLAERRYLKGASAIHVFFDPELSHLNERRIDRPFVIAPNGYDPPDDRSWDPDNDRYLCWLGRYDIHHKGLDLLVDALHRLPAPDRPRVRLVGVDWRGGKARIQERVQRLGLSDDVSIEAPRYGDEKWTLLTRSSGFLYPSRWDASPVAVVEATSIGVPSLFGPFPIGRFIAAHGGAISVEADPRSIAEGIVRLTSDDAAEIGRRGREVIRDHLSWETVARRWLDQVEPLLRDPDRRVA